MQRLALLCAFVRIIEPHLRPDRLRAFAKPSMIRASQCGPCRGGMLQQLHAFHPARIALFVLGAKAKQISSLAQFDSRAVIVRL